MDEDEKLTFECSPTQIAKALPLLREALQTVVDVAAAEERGEKLTRITPLGVFAVLTNDFTSLDRETVKNALAEALKAQAHRTELEVTERVALLLGFVSENGGD